MSEQQLKDKILEILKENSLVSIVTFSEDFIIRDSEFEDVANDIIKVIFD